MSALERGIELRSVVTVALVGDVIDDVISAFVTSALSAPFCINAILEIRSKTCRLLRKLLNVIAIKQEKAGEQAKTNDSCRLKCFVSLTRNSLFANYSFRPQ